MGSTPVTGATWYIATVFGQVAHTSCEKTEVQFFKKKKLISISRQLIELHFFWNSPCSPTHGSRWPFPFDCDCRTQRCLQSGTAVSPHVSHYKHNTAAHALFNWSAWILQRKTHFVRIWDHPAVKQPAFPCCSMKGQQNFRIICNSVLG